MNQIIKAYTGIYLLLLLMMGSTGVIGAHLQILQVQNLHSMIVDELENSDYAKPILEAAVDLAEEWGYKLELVLYREQESGAVCKVNTDIPAEVDDVFMAKVQLEYELSMSFFDINAPQKLVGYAR